MTEIEKIESDLKELIVTALKLEEITPAQIDSNKPLFVEGLGLDSIDALELSVALSKKYGVKIDGKTKDYKKHFASIANLAAFVHQAKEN